MSNMTHYDNTKTYDNKKEMIMDRFIVPISSSYFRIIDKFEYNVEKDIIEIIADNISTTIGQECKIIRGSPNDSQKKILVKIKQWYDKWEEYLKQEELNGK